MGVECNRRWSVGLAVEMLPAMREGIEMVLRASAELLALGQASAWFFLRVLDSFIIGLVFGLPLLFSLGVLAALSAGVVLWFEDQRVSRTSPHAPGI